MDDRNRVSIADHKLIISNNGLHIAPSGDITMVMSFVKLYLNGTVDWSVDLPVSREELDKLINALKSWETMFRSVTLNDFDPVLPEE